ncbi:MAG: family 43 glycosylhydrolase [Lachnospiraceae bacterium]|nr:family 43 glycosylhydrolase [Lachnospiraceae bacterium]
MKRPAKRFGALLLAIAMVITGLPVSNWGVTKVLAANEIVEDEQEVKIGEEIIEVEQDGEEQVGGETSLLAHYSFSGLTSALDGGMIEDESGNGYDATLKGSGASYRKESLVLPGGASGSTAAYVSLPTGMFDGRNVMTISLWLQNTTGKGNYAAMYVGNTKSGSFPTQYWLLNPCNPSGYFKSVMTDSLNESAPYNTETAASTTTTGSGWAMYTTVITETEIIGYLDGNEVKRVAKSRNISDFGTELKSYIGKSEYSDKFYAGAVKEVKVYTGALGEDEIKALYNEQIPASKNATSIKATSVSMPSITDITMTEGETKALPKNVTVTLSDGSKVPAVIQWTNSVTGKTVTQTKDLEAGSYTLQGKINYFESPLIEERADPYIIYDSEEDCYYFTSSWPAYGNMTSGYNKIVLRKADTLEELATATDHTIWTAHTTGTEQKYHIWAPELHKINGKWYVYYAASTADNGWGIRCFALECTGSDLLSADSWTEKGKFTDKDGGTNGFNDMCLDMTYFENDGIGYVIWAYKTNGDSSLSIAPVDMTSPWKLAGEPMILSVPEYAWERVNENVNEGPSVLKKDGKIYVSYSASATGDEYCMGLLTADASSDLMKLSSWTKTPYPVLETSDMNEEYGPGHNSFTTDKDGNVILVYHSRDKECHENQCAYASSDPLYDPCRNAMLAYIRYADDGTPVFSSSAQKELSGVDTGDLSLNIEVNPTNEEKNPIAVYSLLTDGSNSVATPYSGTVSGNSVTFDKGMFINGTAGQYAKNYLDLSSNTDLLSTISNTNELTVSAWVKNTATGNAKSTVFSFGKDSSNFFAFNTLNWSNGRASFKVGGSEVVGIKYDTTGNVASPTGEWYPVSIILKKVSSGTLLRYYMNDKLICEYTTAADIDDLGALTYFRIGAGADSNYYDFTGGIRNFRIYDKALSAAEIADADRALAVESLILEMGAEGEDNALTANTDLPLKSTYRPDLTIQWSSSDENMIATDGVVSRPLNTPATVSLNAVITSTADTLFSKTISFKVTVPVEEPNENELVVHYDMSVSNSTSVNDITGNGHDGTIVNGKTDTSAIYGGEDVLNLNGENSTYVTIPEGTVNGLSDLTVSMLLNNTGSKNATWGWGLGQHSGKYFHMTPTSSSGGVLRIGVGNNTEGNGWNGEAAVVGNTGLSAADWTVVTATFSSADKTIKLYRDKALIGSSTFTCSLSDLITTGKVNGYIGKSFYSSDPYFTGSIADFRIYDGVFTSAQIRTLVTQMQEEVKNCCHENIQERMIGKNTSLNEVKTNLTLPENMNGNAIMWSSSDTNVISISGNVVRPAYSNGNAVVTMTASLNLNGVQQTETYQVTVIEKDDPAKLLLEDKDSLVVNNADHVKGNVTLQDMGKNGSVITWKSSNPQVVSANEVVNENYDPTPAGVVKRQDQDTTVKLTATLTLEGESLEKEFNLTVKAKKTAEPKTDYLFAYFIGNNPGQEEIYMATSRDGLDWKELNEGNSILESNMGTKGLRDPFIIRSPEEDKFYMIATDLRICTDWDWGKSQTDGSQYIMIWESDDLVNWSDQRMVKINSDAAGCTWAPEAFYDEVTGEYMVFWASKVSTDNYAKQRIYYSKTRDFYTFTEPQVWIDKDKSTIDTTVIKNGSTYYRFSKNETQTTIILEKSDSLMGTWTSINSPTLTAQAGVEGPTSFKFNSDDSSVDKWAVLLDNFGGIGYYPLTTTSLEGGVFTKITNANLPTYPRHGTVMNVTAEEYKRITAAYGIQPSTEEESEDEILSYDFEDVAIPMKESISGSNGNLYGNATIIKDAEKDSNVLYLDGTSGTYAELPKGILDRRNTMTISMDVKSVNDSGNYFTFGLGKDSSKYLFLKTTANKIRYAITRGSYSKEQAVAQDLTTSITNVWKNITLVLTEDKMSLYVDGVLANENTSLGTNICDLGSSLSAYLGKSFYSGDGTFKGYFDNVKVYNRALSDNEINKVANAKKLTVSGISLEDKVYDGKGFSYSGKAHAEGYNGKFEYIWSTEDGKAPVNTGSYTLTVRVPEDEMDYVGSTKLQAKITKRKLTVSANNVNILLEKLDGLSNKLGYSFTDGTSFVTGDSWISEPTIVTEQITNVGTYPISLSSGNAGNNYDVTYQDGLLTVTTDIHPYKIQLKDDFISFGTSTYTYSGDAIIPKTILKNGKTKLVLNANYKLIYADNIDAGTATVTAIGMGDYTGTASKTFTIAPKSMSKVRLSDISNCIYTGNAVNPVFTVTDGVNKLEEGVDYTAIYNPADLTGSETTDTEITVTVEGKGNYAGVAKSKKKFKILATSGSNLTSMETVNIVFKDSKGEIPRKTYVYTGSVQKPKILLTDAEGKKLKTSNYKVVYSDCINAGTATITIVGQKSYYGSKTLHFEITKKQLSKVKVKKLPNVVYDKNNVTDLTLTVKDKNKVLVKGEDYTAVFENLDEISTKTSKAKVTLYATENGNYTGSTKPMQFSIIKRALRNKNAVVVSIADATVNSDKSAVKPAVTVTYYGEVLTEGTDYTLTYSGNKKATKNAKVKVTAVKNSRYSGNVTVKFTITK